MISREREANDLHFVPTLKEPIHLPKTVKLLHPIFVLVCSPSNAHPQILLLHDLFYRIKSSYAPPKGLSALTPLTKKHPNNL
jgi:hypothetical protein